MTINQKYLKIAKLDHLNIA